MNITSIAPLLEKLAKTSDVYWVLQGKSNETMSFVWFWGLGFYYLFQEAKLLLYENKFWAKIWEIRVNLSYLVSCFELKGQTD